MLCVVVWCGVLSFHLAAVCSACSGYRTCGCGQGWVARGAKCLEHWRHTRTVSGRCRNLHCAPVLDLLEATDPTSQHMPLHMSVLGVQHSFVVLQQQRMLSMLCPGCIPPAHMCVCPATS